MCAPPAASAGTWCSVRRMWVQGVKEGGDGVSGYPDHMDSRGSFRQLLSRSQCFTLSLSLSTWGRVEMGARGNASPSFFPFDFGPWDQQAQTSAGDVTPPPPPKIIYLPRVNLDVESGTSFFFVAFFSSLRGARAGGVAITRRSPQMETRGTNLRPSIGLTDIGGR